MQKERRTWLIAVSAGPDSMALLDMSWKKGISCAAAHVNYHHRPEAEEEEAYLRAYCAEKQIPLFVRNEPFVHTGNFEAAARKHRYDFFVQTVRENNYEGVMIAHQEDDLIETYIMQKEKNLIPEYYGLKEDMIYQGIRVRRPLLHYTKQELQKYCDDNGVRYFIDSTNEEDVYTRNRIRHQEVEPMSRFERDMILQEIRKENAVLQERRCRVHTYIQEERVQLSSYRQLGEDDRLALLRDLLGNEKWSKAHLCEIDEILRKKDDFIIPAKEKQIVQENGTFFLREAAQPYRYVYENEEQLRNAVSPYFHVTEGSPGVNALTLQKEDYPVTIRSFEDGDRIQMRFGTKSVHRFFIDRHIPLYKRPLWPVVVNSKGTVILVPGLGCDVYHFSMSPDIDVLQYLG